MPRAHGPFAGAPAAGGRAQSPPPPPPPTGGGFTVQLPDEGGGGGGLAAAAAAARGDASHPPPSPAAAGASVADAGMPHVRPLNMSAVHALEAELEHDLLLSQRALDFLAEVPSLPGTNPGTPRAASGRASRAMTPASLSPLTAGSAIGSALSSRAGGAASGGRRWPTTPAVE